MQKLQHPQKSKLIKERKWRNVRNNYQKNVGGGTPRGAVAMETVYPVREGKKIIVPKVCLVEFLTNAGNYQTPSPTVPNNLWTYEDGCDSVGVARECTKPNSQKKGA